MPDTYMNALLHNPENTAEKWLPYTVAENVQYGNSSTVKSTLDKYGTSLNQFNKVFLYDVSSQVLLQDVLYNILSQNPEVLTNYNHIFIRDLSGQLQWSPGPSASSYRLVIYNNGDAITANSVMSYLVNNLRRKLKVSVFSTRTYGYGQSTMDVAFMLFKNGVSTTEWMGNMYPLNVGAGAYFYMSISGTPSFLKPLGTTIVRAATQSTDGIYAVSGTFEISAVETTTVNSVIQVKCTLE